MKYMPLCMGVCPAHYDSSNLCCKLDSLDLSFEESIINQIESSIGK